MFFAFRNLQHIVNKPATEVAVVRQIFDKYVHEGFGAQRISTYLNNLGYRARSGKMWHPASIRGIICNLTYTGVLCSGESCDFNIDFEQFSAGLDIVAIAA